MSRRVLLAVPFLTVAFAAVSFAQIGSFPGKPANPGRLEFHTAYHAQGQFSNGYRPLWAWSYQNTARTHAQALYTYGQSVKKIDSATANDHIAEVKKGVAASKQELAKIDVAAAKKADVHQHLDALTKYYDEAEKLTASMEKAAADGDAAGLSTASAGVDKALAAAAAEHKKLMDSLHIALPGHQTTK